MIPILYPSTETAFTSEGLGRLTDARKCEVTEERNGTYELVLEYPVSGDMTTELVPGRYIFATHDDSGVPQAFQIYNVSIPLEGFVTVRAWHISYALNTIVVEPFTASTCAAAMAGLSTNSMNTNPFTFWTNKTVSADFAVTTPKSVREVLGGSAGSILDVYGKGEYEFDMFTVKLHLNRGQNNGVQIRYGKNLTKLDQTIDGSNVYNAIVPYWQNNEDMVYVDHVVVRTGETAKGVVPYDLSGEFDDAPTSAELETRAQAIIDASDNYALKENINVDFVPLWQTEEYKQYADLERVKLCDTVNIYYEKAGVNVTAQVVKVVYNTLLDRYNSMTIGEPRTTLAQQIAQEVVEQVTPQVPVIIRRTIIKTDGTYPSGWKGSTAIENATYSAHAETTGFHADGQMNAEGFEFTSVDESDNSYEKLSGLVDAQNDITQVKLENSVGNATTLQATGISTTGAINALGDIKGRTHIAKNTTGNGAQVVYQFTDLSDATAANIWAQRSNYGGRLRFREHSGNSGGILGTYEEYVLPTVDVGRAANATYDILTSKTIRTGEAVASAAVKSGYGDINVTFSPAFPSGTTPIVIACLGATAITNTNAGQVSLWVMKGTITNTGFTARFFNSTATNITPSILYFAIV